MQLISACQLAERAQVGFSLLWRGRLYGWLLSSSPRPAMQPARTGTFNTTTLNHCAENIIGREIIPIRKETNESNQESIRNPCYFHGGAGRVKRNCAIYFLAGLELVNNLAQARALGDVHRADAPAAAAQPSHLGSPPDP